MTKNVVAELLANPEGRRALSVKSPVFFDTYYCAMRFAAHRERWLSKFYETIERAKETKDKARMLVLAPRDHGKTEAAVTLCVSAICQNRDIRILWISEALGQAEKRMRRVKALLESKKIQEDWCSNPEKGFGPFKQTDEDRWMATQVYVARTLQSVDPTLEAVGSGGAITGGHFDLIIADDLEDDKTTYTENQRQKTRDWFRGTISPMLVRGGTMIVIGTRKHHSDLYSYMLEDPTWRVMEDKAISKFPDSYHFITEQDDRGREVIVDVHVEGKAEVLWEAERDIKYLLREKQTVGQVLFSREFQNEVQDDSAAAFRMEWIKSAKERGKDFSLYDLPEEGLDIVQGWDLSLVTDAKGAATRDTDFTVGVTWAKDANGHRYLLGIRRERGLSPARLRSVIMAEYQRFGGKVRKIAVERNNFGELIFMGLQKSTDLPLTPHLTTGKKKADPWEGVPSLSILFENQKVTLPNKTQQDQEALEPLVAELWGLGRERHDDTVMALWIAETVLRKASFNYAISFGDDADLSESNVVDIRNGKNEYSEPMAKIWNSMPWFTGD